MVFIIKRNIWINLFFLFLIMIKQKFKNIEKFHLNEIELIITAPLLKFFLNLKLPAI